MSHDDNQFEIHTTDSAPEDSRATLEQAQEAFGMVPNLLGMLAGAPTALKAYTQLSGVLEEGSFSPEELQTVLLAVSVENECHYCVAAHSALAANAGMSEERIHALRDGRALDDPRLEALRRFAVRLVRERGWVDAEHVEELVQAGFRRPQALEVVTAVALKTISNYANHLAETPVDAAFERWTWDPKMEESRATA